MWRMRKHYKAPPHPWQRARIEEEAKLRKEYGFKSKREFWKMQAILRGFRAQARKLFARRGSKQAEIEERQLLESLQRLGLLKEGAELEDVLKLEIKDIMERRLQTILVKKKLARSVKQARQLIAHRRVWIGEKKATSPSYLVKVEEEGQIRVR